VGSTWGGGKTVGQMGGVRSGVAGLGVCLCSGTGQFIKEVVLLSGCPLLLGFPL